MARIAEDLALLLLDNASAQPALDRARHGRVLSAAVLLDLAYACRIRPAVDHEPVQAGQLVALIGPEPTDPVLTPALQMLLRRPMSPAVAIAKLRRQTTGVVLSELQACGHIHRVRLQGNTFSGFQGFRPVYAWPLLDRTRVDEIRTTLMSVLLEHGRPDPAMAALIALLHSVDGLRAVLSLNERAWEWALHRAGDIASGSWVRESEPELAEVNLAVTAAAIRQALTARGGAN
ncbi:MAG: GPP34 family phosphoprotein [Mycobacterium sp.]|uniref:GOLPH3/VPS74 family protein n=1 Tax=Mycobacterium sp. TaxID=1785 RepID=UPI003C55C941